MSSFIIVLTVSAKNTGASGESREVAPWKQGQEDTELEVDQGCIKGEAVG